MPKKLYENMKKAQSENPDAIIVLYEQEMEWARHFNHVIWFSASILLPIAFAGLSLYEKLDPMPFILLAIASVTILLFWHFVSEGHRKLWKNKFKTTNLIEQVWSLRDEADKKGPLTGKSKKSVGVKEARLIVVVVGILIWFVSVLVKLDLIFI